MPARGGRFLLLCHEGGCNVLLHRSMMGGAVPKRIAERVDDLLDAVLLLRRELADAGHLVSGRSDDVVASLLARPSPSGAPPPGPYEEIAPGVCLGFRKGSRPDLVLRPAGGGALEIALRRPTDSGWLTVEMELDPAVLARKGQATLLLRGASPTPLSLNCLLRLATEGGARDLAGPPVALGPDPAPHTVRFACPPGGPGEGCRAILFLPTEPFSISLTELSLL